VNKHPDLHGALLHVVELSWEDDALVLTIRPEEMSTRLLLRWERAAPGKLDAFRFCGLDS